MAIQSEQITKPIHFLDALFEFKGINGESIVLEMSEDGAEELYVMLP